MKKNKTEPRRIGGLFSLCLAIFCLTETVVLSLTITPLIIVCVILFALASAVLCVSGKAFGIRPRRIITAFSKVTLAISLGIAVAYLAVHSSKLPAERLLAKYADAEEVALAVRIDKTVSVGENYGIYDGTVILTDGRNAREEFGAYPRLRISAFGQSPQSIGEIIAFNGALSIPEEYTDDNFALKRYLESKEIFIACDVSSTIRIVGNQRDGAFSRFRRRLSMGLSRCIRDSDAAALARCLLLGERDAVSDEIRDTFRASGASHILSVSGMHLTILLCFISLVLGLGKRKRRRFPFAELITCGIAFVYMAVASFTPSIMRAGLMLILANLFSVCAYYIRKLCHNPKDNPESPTADKEETSLEQGVFFGALEALLGSAAIVGVVSPYSLLDVGMQLSLLSTLGIIIAIPITAKISDVFGFSAITAFLSSCTVTLFAVSFTLPISAYSFGELSTMSVLSNLVLAPIITPLLVILLLTALLSVLPFVGLVGFVCGILGRLATVLAKICIGVCDLFGRTEFSVVDIGRDSIILIVLTVALVIVIASAFILRAFARKNVASVVGLGAVLLYLVSSACFFTSTYAARSVPSLAIHTVSQNPYLCIAKRDSRIFLDCARGYYSAKHLSDSAGEALYATKDYYILLPSDDTDFTVAYRNASLIAKERGLEAVLMPSPTALSRQKADYGEYRELVKRLEDDGIDIVFYEDEITVCGLEFDASIEENACGVLFGEYSFIFGERYDEELASRLSEDSEYCLYFCKKAGKTDNLRYGSRAKLYVTSSEKGKISGALSIAAGASESFPTIE